jgi:hypothetical protein
MRKLIHDGSLRVFIWLRLGNRGLRGLFSLRMCQTCNGHDDKKPTIVMPLAAEESASDPMPAGLNRKKRTVHHRVEKTERANQNNNGRPMLIAKSRQRS